MSTDTAKDKNIFYQVRPRQRYRNESIAEYERDSMFETSLSIESKADSQTTGEQSLKENLPEPVPEGLA